MVLALPVSGMRAESWFPEGDDLYARVAECRRTECPVPARETSPFMRRGGLTGSPIGSRYGSRRGSFPGSKTPLVGTPKEVRASEPGCRRTMFIYI